jgi:hypothetical protein
MATIITAGNATNGLKITPDNTGILELKTGTGAGTTALTLNASQNATLAGTLQVAGVTTSLYPLVSSTAQTAPFTDNTRADFLSIPSWAKRITVMFQGVSTSGTSIVLIQLGTSGGIAATGYLGAAADLAGATVANYTTGFGTSQAAGAATVRHGAISIQNITGNSWTANGVLAASNGAQIYPIAGSVSLSGTLDRVRITTVNGTDTFDSGSVVNIMWE